MRGVSIRGLLLTKSSSGFKTKTAQIPVLKRPHFLEKVMATASSSVPRSSSSSAASKSRIDLLKQIRSHEIALAELGTLSSSKGVYERNGNIFFRTTVQKATASEQKELDRAKLELKRLNGS